MPPIIYAHADKEEKSPVLFPSDEGERPLQNTSPAGQAKVFIVFLSSIIQDIFCVGHPAESWLFSDRDGAT